MNLSATTKWIALALLGLAIAAAVAIAASNLVSRQIGIASESVSAGDALAPAVESAARQANKKGGATPTPGDTPPATTAEPEGTPDGGGAAEPTVTTEDSDRIDEEEDALKDRLDEEEDARDDREDALEDLEDDSGGSSDNSGHGSDD